MKRGYRALQKRGLKESHAFLIRFLQRLASISIQLNVATCGPQVKDIIHLQHLL
jgi:hypothetical protein